MKISSVLQMQDLLIMFSLGICLGVFYGILNITNHIRQKLFMQIFCDIIFISTAFITYAIILQVVNFGSLRLYLLAGYVTGFAIERISLGNLFAKGAKSVYNKLKIFITWFKTSKLGKFIFK